MAAALARRRRSVTSIERGVGEPSPETADPLKIDFNDVAARLAGCPHGQQHRPFQIGGHDLQQRRSAVVLLQHQFPGGIEPVVADREGPNVRLAPDMVTCVSHHERQCELIGSRNRGRRRAGQRDRCAVRGVGHRLDLSLGWRLEVGRKLEHQQAAGTEQAEELAKVANRNVGWHVLQDNVGVDQLKGASRQRFEPSLGRADVLRPIRVSIEAPREVDHDRRDISAGDPCHATRQGLRESSNAASEVERLHVGR